MTDHHQECTELLDRIPDAGLREAAIALRGLVDFYEMVDSDARAEAEEDDGERIGFKVAGE